LPLAAPKSRIRTLNRDETNGVAPSPTLTPTPVGTRTTVGTSSVRPISQDAAGARVHIVAPGRFADAQEIANRLMNNQPVIVNMQSADRDLQRRMIDFCSGVTYALSGGMERVADEVFLLTPSNVKVSDEERQRLADRGLVNP
jgi:cell division inhibitor SepF